VCFWAPGGWSGWGGPRRKRKGDKGLFQPGGGGGGEGEEGGGGGGAVAYEHVTYEEALVQICVLEYLCSRIMP